MRFLRHRLTWTLFALLAGMCLCMLAASQMALQKALNAESASVQRQLMLYAQTLSQRIDRYRTLPQVLALDEQLQLALDHRLDAAEIDHLNRKLERANGASHSSTLTLIDLHGKAIAASNWREQQSNVGEDYSFRPYVQQALSIGSGRFYGIGMTTGQPGYFLSQAIRNESGVILGLIAIKIELQELEREWRQSPDIVMASDSHGVVFLASSDAWRYRLLHTLSPADIQEMESTRQFADRRLQPWQYELDKTLSDGGRLVRISEPAQIGRAHV